MKQPAEWPGQPGQLALPEQPAVQLAVPQQPAAPEQPAVAWQLAVPEQPATARPEQPVELAWPEQPEQPAPRPKQPVARPERHAWQPARPDQPGWLRQLLALQRPRQPIGPRFPGLQGEGDALFGAMRSARLRHRPMDCAPTAAATATPSQT